MECSGKAMSGGFHMKSAMKDQQFARNGKAYVYFSCVTHMFMCLVDNTMAHQPITVLLNYDVTQLDWPQ